MTTLLDTLDPIFADCLGKSDRFILDKPWIRKGFAYATNGSILIRQPTPLPETQHRGPRAWDIFDDSKPIGRSIPLPDIGPELADTLICPTCKAKDSTGTCKDCKGLGKHVCPTCKREKPCGACDGEGTQYCLECGGDGTVARKRQPVKLRPTHEIGLADYYVWLLRRHEIVSVRRANRIDGTGRSAHVGFRFRKGTIEGIVLGMALGVDDDG